MVGLARLAGDRQYNVFVDPMQIDSQTEQTRCDRCATGLLDGISLIDYDRCIIADLGF
jgi:hypothetical protein